MDRSLLRLADGPCLLSFQAPRAHERAHDSGRRPASLAKVPRGLDPEWRPDSIGVAGSLVERVSKTRASTRPEFTETSVNVRGEVHAYLPPEHHRRLKLEAAARQVSLSQCVADCLGEYFALRQEMATALETPAQPDGLSRRVIPRVAGGDRAAPRGHVRAVRRRPCRGPRRRGCPPSHVRPRGVPRPVPDTRGAPGGPGPGTGERPAAVRALAPDRGSHAPRLGAACAMVPGGTRASQQSRAEGGAGPRGRRTRGAPLYLAVHLPPFTEYSLNRLH